MKKRKHNPRHGGKFKISPTVISRLCKAISMGAPYALACKYAGITDDTLARWLKRAETKGEERIFATLKRKMDLAEGEAAVRWLAIIERGAQNGDWRAAFIKLERRYPEMFGRMQIEHTGKDGKDLPTQETHVHVTLDLSKLTNEEVQNYRDLMAKLAADRPGLGAATGGNGAGETQSR